MLEVFSKGKVHGIIRCMNKTEKNLPAPRKIQEIKVKEDPKLKKIKELPPEVLAAAIRDALRRDK